MEKKLGSGLNIPDPQHWIPRLMIFVQDMQITPAASIPPPPPPPAARLKYLPVAGGRPGPAARRSAQAVSRSLVRLLLYKKNKINNYKIKP
jgi:hypothetical protein